MSCPASMISFKHGSHILWVQFGNFLGSFPIVKLLRHWQHLPLAGIGYDDLN
jgi:hypothetical protein